MDKESATCFWRILGGSNWYRMLYHPDKDPFFGVWLLAPQMRRHFPMAYKTIYDKGSTVTNPYPLWCVSPSAGVYDSVEFALLLGPVFPFAF